MRKAFVAVALAIAAGSGFGKPLDAPFHGAQAAVSSAPSPAGSLVGQVFKGPNTVLQRLKRPHSLDFGGDGLARRVVHAGEIGGVKHVIVLMYRGNDWVVSADLAITALPRGLTFAGSNDASEDESGTRCVVGGREIEAFGFMRRSGTTFVSAHPAWVWWLDTAGHPLPLKGAQVICR